tara:strand:- start:234 stop:500 length:267 start_codon:yes stop_codon:yes gene_type:complete
VKIIRMTKGSWGLNLAFFDIEVGGVTIKGFKLIEKDGSRFVGVPSKKKENGEGYDNIVYLGKEKYNELCSMAKDYYDNEPQPTQGVPF